MRYLPCILHHQIFDCEKLIVLCNLLVRQLLASLMSACWYLQNLSAPALNVRTEMACRGIIRGVEAPTLVRSRREIISSTLPLIGGACRAYENRRRGPGRAAQARRAFAVMPSHVTGVAGNSTLKCGDLK